MVISGLMPQRISRMDMRTSGATKRMSQPAASWIPAPKATPCTAAMTGTGSSRQPHTACWALWVMRSFSISPMLLVLLSPPPAIDWNPEKSRPAHQAGPLPDSTTARNPSVFASSSAVSISALNIGPSMAFILSPRLRRTSAMPSLISTVMRSDIRCSTRPGAAVSDPRMRAGTPPTGAPTAPSFTTRASAPTSLPARTTRRR